MCAFFHKFGTDQNIALKISNGTIPPLISLSCTSFLIHLVIELSVPAKQNTLMKGLFFYNGFDLMTYLFSV